MPILPLSEREAHEIAARQLIKLERQFREWWEGDGLHLGDAERHDVLLNVSDQLTALEGGTDTGGHEEAKLVLLSTPASPKKPLCAALP